MTVAYHLSAGTVERRIARQILAHVSGYTETQLVAHPNYLITPEASLRFFEYISRYNNEEPLASILGWTEFYGLHLAVSQDTLIPRPDTECLVEQAIQAIKSIEQPKVLDLGTGSGAIALAIASAHSKAIIYAVDISPNALYIAQQNARSHQKSIHFIASNWLTSLYPTPYFDLIVSNPPYIDEDYPHLNTLLQYEPKLALSSKDNGLYDLRHLFLQAPPFLKPQGRLLCEHGWQQGADCRHLAQLAGLTDIQTWKDLSHHERVTGGQKPTN